MINELSKHDAIGWDVDKTLYEGVHTNLFRDFIFANPQKRHCLVTFRTHNLLDRLESDLATAGFRDISIFDGIFSVPSNIWLDWAVTQQRRRDKQVHVPAKPIQSEIAFMEWKGFLCRTEKLTALVDDDILNTERGCKRYGIKLFDANDFW